MSPRVLCDFSYHFTLLIRQGQELVTHGIYRHLRHPIYLGSLMICLGVPVHSGSPLGFVTMAVLVPVFLNRIRLEEGLLAEEYGEEYEAYRASTPRLIPFLW